MTAREVRVYRLLVAYPEGSDKPGWTPACWEMLLADMPWKLRRSARDRGFRWPRERMFLSAGAANHRAFLLRWFGAEAEVQASAAVTWWEDADAASWCPELADEDEGLSCWADEAAQFATGVAAGQLAAYRRIISPGDAYPGDAEFWAEWPDVRT